ncbi:MAG: DUF4221 family protein [Lunatimonas sp.]|uniref:DUF4221 family protein n=1 Tax=Lunatimonas sp. TaxID=2060141 RepID=UPI00263A6172|nr:DUF4221 family protein [Lunatimonas sp.]MCC5938074.1 DUF4221 family protein [Lunatimonas sp.]
MTKFCFFIIFLIAACGSPEKGNLGQQRQLYFTLDTVLVDPGDEILYLRANLGNAELSADERFLYNYNPKDHALEKIDLDELKLVKKIAFEKEGPQGTGPFFTPFFLLGGDSILVAGSLKHAAIFNLEGEKLTEVSIQQVLDQSGILDGGNRFRIKSIITGDSNQYLGFLTDWSAKFLQLMKVDMDESKLAEFDLPAFDKLDDYRVTQFSGGEIIGFLGSQVLLQTEGESIVISNNVFNELYVYLPEKDSLLLKTYESRLTPNQKTPYYPKQVESDEALYRIYATSLAEIEFERLFWDKINERYYRFSYQTDMEIVEENGHYSRSSNSSTIFLTVFDKNLEMLGESRIPELNKVPGTYFVKDGAIWIFENMEDELGFLRLSIDL